MKNVKELWWSKTNLAPMYKTNDGEIHIAEHSQLLMVCMYDYVCEMTYGVYTEDIPEEVWLGHVSDYLQHLCISNDIRYLGIKK